VTLKTNFIFKTRDLQIMSSFKFVYGDVMRRVLIREDGGKLTYSQLINTLLNLFPSLAGKNFQIYWEDDEGDLILCSSDAELDEAVNVLQFLQSKVLKFIVKLPNGDQSEPAAVPNNSNIVHTGITCDECGMSPIIGIRYKCTVRNDFDLCAACEAKRVQPHAMIKIFDPSQAPAVLVYGLDEDRRERWQRGCRQPQGHHHSPHPAHPHGGQGHQFPLGPLPHPQQWGHGGRGRRHCERWAKRWGEKFNEFAKDPCPVVAPVVAPFISAMDAAINAFIPPETTTPSNNAGNNNSTRQQEETNTTANLEQELIEKAIMESLLFNEDKPPTPAVTAEKPKPVPHVETARPAVPTLPKPALRFVKDATFPDGTVVPPGASFRKAWKVRNDGSYPWPEGTSLVSVGGDVMSDPDHKELLPVIKPEEEAEIALQLTAPELPGMYTAYYRAQTKEQQYFGQRLWASVVVAELESDWQVVTEDKNKVAPALAAAEAPVVASAPSPATAASVEESSTVLPPPVPSSTAVEESKQQTEEEEQQPSVAHPEAMVVQQTPQQIAGLRSAILLWRRELEVLDAMGFSDPATCVPLLQQYLGSPLSLSADKNASPNVEGMQQVVATLLQMN
jgi:hypothetical protein